MILESNFAKLLFFLAEKKSHSIKVAVYTRNTKVSQKNKATNYYKQNTSYGKNVKKGKFKDAFVTKKYFAHLDHAKFGSRHENGERQTTGVS